MAKKKKVDAISDKKKSKKRMVNITINIPEIYDKNIQKLIKMKITPNRSECIRTALRDFLHNEYENLKLLGYFEGVKSEKMISGRKLGEPNLKTKLDDLLMKLQGKDNMINYLKAELDKYEKGVKNHNTK